MRALLVLALLTLGDAHRVLLVFPAPTRSHVNLGEGYLRPLLQAGHQVTYITPVPVKNPPKNLRQIDVSSNFPLIRASEILDLTKLMKKEIPQMTTQEVLALMLSISNGTLRHDNVQKLLRDPREEFDVVIAEWLFGEVYSGLAAVFGCPLIWSTSMEPHAMVLSIIHEDPNPAYVAHYSSTVVPPFNFQQRVASLWTFLTTKYHKWVNSLEEASLYEDAFAPAAVARSRQLIPYHSAKYNASMTLGNSHVSGGSSLSLPMNYVSIAGYHLDDNTKPLPTDLQSIMDNAKNGVIYFSMGSILKTTTMSTELQRDLLHMFGQLKQTVIWKLEEAQQNLPNNVHLVGFAPQQSILAHPNCVLFITHGGLLSSTEALHFGVPIIGIPVFADQFLNIDRAVRKGYAKKVDLDPEIPHTLKEAIEDILGNPSYRDRMKELSFVYHHRPVKPGAELAHWVEHVVRTRGAPHLRSPALLLPWYQKMYLDLLALVLLVVLLSFFVVRRFVLSKKIDVNKNNKVKLGK